MNYIRTNLYILVLACLLQGCSSDINGKIAAYKAEVMALCEVFNPENWKELPDNLEPYEIQKKLTDKMSAAIKSDEVKEIISSVSSVKADMRYKYYTDSVSNLIGEAYSCPEIKSYLTIE